MVQIDIPWCTARFSPHQAVQVGAVQMRTTACHRMALRAPQSEEPRTTFLLLTCGLVTNFCHGCTKSHNLVKPLANACLATRAVVLESVRDHGNLYGSHQPCAKRIRNAAVLTLTNARRSGKTLDNSRSLLSCCVLSELSVRMDVSLSNDVHSNLHTSWAP